MRQVFLSALACAGIASAQTFDVASVKPHPQSGDMRIMVRMAGGCPDKQDPGRLIFENVTVKNVLPLAFGVKSYQITGPATMEGDRFDITAKVPPGTTKEQCQTMLQNLLAERFKMSVHHEKKELPAMALVVGKNGPKMKKYEEAAKGPDDPPAPKPGPGDVPFGRGGPMGPSGRGGRMGPGGMRMMMQQGKMHLTATGIEMSQFAEMLGNQTGQPVVDETGLTDRYDIDFEFASEGMRAMGGMPMMPPGGAPGGGGGVVAGGGGGSAGGPAPEGDSAPSIQSAVQELGLKLESKKVPLDIVVVDHIEKMPTEN